MIIAISRPGEAVAGRGMLVRRILRTARESRRGPRRRLRRSRRDRRQRSRRRRSGAGVGGFPPVHHVGAPRSSRRMARRQPMAAMRDPQMPSACPTGTNGQPKGVEISHTLIIQSPAKIAMKMATVRMMFTYIWHLCAISEGSPHAWLAILMARGCHVLVLNLMPNQPLTSSRIKE